MNIEEVREYLLSLPDVEEVNPFSKDSEIIIYKIGGKWFAAYLFERPEFLAVKCAPDRAVLQRDRFCAITPVWHFNKKHWNDLCFGALSGDVVKQEIRHSYLTVIRKNVTPKLLKKICWRTLAEPALTMQSLLNSLCVVSIGAPA